MRYWSFLVPASLAVALTLLALQPASIYAQNADEPAVVEEPPGPLPRGEETKKPEPKQTEPADEPKPEPKKPEPKKPEPKKTEPADEPKPETDKPEPPEPQKPADKPADKPTDKPADKPTPTPEKPSTTRPEPDAPADEPPATPAAPKFSPAQVQAAQAAYSAKLEEWKSLLREMRDLQVEYTLAPSGAAALPLREKWDGLVKQGRELIPQVGQAAQQAYIAAPNTDRELTRFLVKLLDDQIARDRYEPAYELGQTLVANNADAKSIYSAAGVAAFVTNHYDDAEKLFAKAEELGAMSETAAQYQFILPEYKGFWEKEQEIRAAEAKADDLPRVLMKTSEGDITIELLENEAPQTVGNFVSLVEKGFYDGLIFHRVIPGFMAQGGDPDGVGSGGPGYNIYCECEEPDARKHFRGSLSMAHAGKDTGGSQFFLTFVPTSHLNGRHTVFGRVIKGMDVLAKLERTESDKGPLEVEQSKIISAKVLRKRDHEYKPTKVE